MPLPRQTDLRLVENDTDPELYDFHMDPDDYDVGINWMLFIAIGICLVLWTMFVLAVSSLIW